MSEVPAQNAGRPHRQLPGSIRDVQPDSPSLTKQQRRRGVIKRMNLNAAETDATMEFEVTLKMRNFEELQARVGRGEIIPRGEMAARYYPSAQDYQAVLDWLGTQSLTITRQDDNHLAVFVSGTVRQVRDFLRVNFARVESDGEEFTSAVTAPAVPDDIASLLVGINGLQPHLRPHHRAVVAQPNSLSSNFPPYTPAQIARAYNANGVTQTGAGQTIAVIMDAFPLTSDLTSYWSACGINQSLNNVDYVPVNGGPSTPSSTAVLEATLDVEWSSSMAPGARVRLYGTRSLSFTQLDRAYQQIIAEQAGSIPGMRQVSLSYGAGEAGISTSQMQTDAQFFANMASAGISVFAASGDAGSSPGPGGYGDTSGATQVETPANDPSVTGVGGTTLSLNSNSGNVNSETSWSLSGGGVSNVFSRPSWQTGPGVPGGGGRLVPDVSVDGDPNSGGLVIRNGQQTQVGGTSLGTPIWAAFSALINEARASGSQSPLGLLGPKLYPLIGTSAIRDINTGPNMDGRTAYSPGNGYDLCTGIGVPNLAALLQSLVSPVAPTITSQPSGQAASAGSTATFSVSGTGVPTPSYQWYFNGSPIGSATVSTTGSTLTLSNVQLGNAGNYSVTATNSAGSTPSATVTLTVASQPASQTVTTGHSVSFTVSSAGTASFQWQVSTDNGSSWSNLSNSATYSGVNSTTFTINGVNPGMSGYQYRYVASVGGSTGSSSGATLTVATAQFPYPIGIAADAQGNLYVTDASSNIVQKITSGGAVSTLAGSTGVAGSTDGAGAAARFNQPNGVAVDPAGNVYVADTGNSVIRKITSGGVVTTLAGSTTNRGNRDGLGSAAWFSSPAGIAVDASGNVYVADTLNDTIRAITPSGSVTTIAGIAGAPGSADGPGATAQFNHPMGITVDGTGNLYVTDAFNDTVRKITTSRVVTTMAGLAGVAGTTDGNTTSALFNQPNGIAIDLTGNLYVADTANATIRKISSGGAVTTLAGLPGVAGFANGAGTSSMFNQPNGLTVDAAANVYVADTGNATIRKVAPNGSTATVAATAYPSAASSPSPSTPAPTTTTTAAAPPPSSGGGGGGGAMSDWFIGSLALLSLIRWLSRRPETGRT